MVDTFLTGLESIGSYIRQLEKEKDELLGALNEIQIEPDRSKIKSICEDVKKSIVEGK